MANMTQQDIDKIGVFWLNDIHIGLPISDILEVVPANALVATPNEHPALLGCLNLRGILIPVYSLFFYFQQDATQSPTFSIVIVQQGNQLLGLQVSGVTDIYSRDQTQSSSLNASPVQSGQTQPFINGAIQIATLPHSVYWLNLAAIFAQPNLLYAEMTDVLQHDTTVMHLPDTSTSMHDTPDQEQDTDDTRHTHLLLLKIGTLQFALNATDISRQFSIHVSKHQPCRVITVLAAFTIPELWSQPLIYRSYAGFAAGRRHHTTPCNEHF